jgi:uncharacterized membrane protein YdbT with pleckstrin-like domain
VTRVPRRLLATDEHVLLATHQHGRRLLVPALVLLAVSPLTTFAVASVERPVFRWLLLAAGVLLLLRYVVRPFLRWLSTSYVLTDRRLLVRGGVVSRWGRDLPLSWVADVTYRRGLLGRLVGSGTLVVDTAGDGGRLVLPHVPRPDEVQREIFRAAELVDDRRHATRL